MLNILRSINAWIEKRIHQKEAKLYQEILKASAELKKEHEGKTPKDATWGGIYPNGIGNQDS